MVSCQNVWLSVLWRNSAVSLMEAIAIVAVSALALMIHKVQEVSCALARGVLVDTPGPTIGWLMCLIGIGGASEM
jgi:hypothetical protein